MTCEITKEFGVGAKCVKFASCGPKNYGYEVILPDNSRKCVMKTKGLKLNGTILQTFNFEEMVKIAEDYSEGRTTVRNFPQMQIRTDKYHNLRTRYMEKMYRAVCEKRIVEGKNTRPYGFFSYSLNV